MKKIGGISIAILLLLIAIALRVWVFKGEAMEGGKAGGPGNKGPSPVQVEIAQAGGLAGDASVTGTILADEQVDLRPETGGRIVWLQMPEGSMVQKGQLLARLNDADLKAQLQKLDAQIQLAKQREQRLAGLKPLGGASADEYETALQTLKSLEADRESVLARLALCEIRAPFAGKLGLRRVSEGSFVSSQDILGSLTKTDGMKVEFSVPARYAASLREGTKVRIVAEGGKDTFRALVFATEGSLDNATRTLAVRARILQPVNRLKPGMFAQVWLETLADARAVNVPTEALVPVLKGAQVFVVEGGKAAPREVETGLRNSGRVEILSGIRAGDSVIVRGLLGLRPGNPVKPTGKR